MRFAAAAVMLLLAACAPQVQPQEQVKLPEREWLPASKPKAVIIALHGFDDYSNAFQNSGKFFKAHGIAVVAYDQRGFGRAPQTGIWAGEENLVADLAEHIKQVKTRWPHTPVYILGESMGGAVAIVALAGPGFPKVHGLILEAPALWGGETMNPFYRAALWTFAHSFPAKKMTGEGLHIKASDNTAMLRLLSLDPLVIKATRVDTIYGLAQLMDDAYAKVPEVKTPVLLLYGAHDEVIPKEPIEKARPRFTAPMDYIYYPDGYHMLLRDLNGDAVRQDILEWIE